MPVTVWAMKEIVVSKIKKKKKYKLLWGAWSRGEGKKEPSNHYYVCWVRVRILAFTYHFWPSISASTLSWFTSLSLRLHRSGALDQYMKDRGDPPGHSEAKLDRFSPPPQRPLPNQWKEGKIGWIYFPNQMMGLSSSTGFWCVHSGTCSWISVEALNMEGRATWLWKWP